MHPEPSDPGEAQTFLFSPLRVHHPCPEGAQWPPGNAPGVRCEGTGMWVLR